MSILKVKQNGVWTDLTGVASHTHNKNEIIGLPTALPANGGNADTLDGFHASSFAMASDVEDLYDKVGDTSVSAQIANMSTVLQSSIDSKVEKVVGHRLITPYEAKKLGAIVIDNNDQIAISGTINADNVQGLSDLLDTKVDKVQGKGLSTNDYTNVDRDKLFEIEAGATRTLVDASLSGSSSNPVQNKIVTEAMNNLSNLVGDTSVAEQINAATDECITDMTAQGASIIYTKHDGTTGSIPTYVHPSYAAKDIGLYKVVIDSTGHVNGTTIVTKDDITALGIPAQDTTYNVVTTSVDGLMSAGDKSKLDGIENGATRVVVDTELNADSTNPVQNKVIQEVISNLNSLVGDTKVSEQIADAIKDKSDNGHAHDDRYYTESEIDTKLSGKADTVHVHDYAVFDHNHDDKYYTESEIDAKLSDKADSIHTHDYAAQNHTHSDLVTQDYFNKITGGTEVSVQINNAIRDHNHDERYCTEAEINDMLSSKSDTDHTHSYAAVDHSHDDLYYTEFEVDTKLAGKADNVHVHDYAASNHTHSDLVTQSEFNEITGGREVSLQISDAIKDHNHDTRYYTESEIDTKLSGKSNTNHNHNDIYALISHGNHVPNTEPVDSAKFLRNDNTWQTVTPANIGAAEENHGVHVTFTEIDPMMDGDASVGLSSDVARSDHRHPTDISRASASDLSALQKMVGDTSVALQIEKALENVSDSKHNHDELYDYKGAADDALQDAKIYADTAAQTVKDDLLNGAGAAYDTLKELGDLIEDNVDAIDALEKVAANKANSSDLTEHINDKTNPHGVTAAQIGADLAGSAESALGNAKSYTDEQIIEWVGDEKVSEQITTAIANKADSNHTHSVYASTVSTTGAGNAITEISQSGSTITATKGATFLTSETSLSKDNASGTGNAVTDITVSGHTITIVKDIEFALKNHTHTAESIGFDASGVVNSAIQSAKDYTDEKIADWVGGLTVSEQVNNAIRDHHHDGRYYTESEVDGLLDNKANANHDHNDNYYQKSEIDTRLGNKSDADHAHNYADFDHSHNDLYYTESEINDKLDGKADVDHVHDYASFTHTHSDLVTQAEFNNITGGTEVSLQISNAIRDHNHDTNYYKKSEIDTKLSGKSDSHHTHTANEIGAYNLLAKETIPQNANLNTYITPGSYVVPSYAYGSTIANNPSNECGTVIVEYVLAQNSVAGGREYLKQTYKTLNGYDLVRTSKNSGATWSDWGYNMTNILPSVCYGTDLPTAGTAGRIFFKKV